MAQTFRKSFPGAAHGQRYSYTIRSQSARAIEWLRSDGLEGVSSLVEWARLWQEVVTPVAPAPKAKTQAKKAAVVKVKPETKEEKREAFKAFVESVGPLETTLLATRRVPKSDAKKVAADADLAERRSVLFAKSMGMTPTATAREARLARRRVQDAARRAKKRPEKK